MELTGCEDRRRGTMKKLVANAVIKPRAAKHVLQMGEHANLARGSLRPFLFQEGTEVLIDLCLHR